MGGSHSVDHALQGRIAAALYPRVVQSNYMPVVGIDQTLWRYSGVDSNSVLKQEYYSFLDKMDTKKAIYAMHVGRAIGPYTAVPNAVGLGALVISIILEIAVAATNNKPASIPDMLRQVFAEEKASAVRDTMHEYLKRHRMVMPKKEELETEMLRLEHQLSEQLTKLRNSISKDKQMTTRSMTLWVNGAAFHILLLTHIVQVKDSMCGSICTDDDRNKARKTIDIYLEDLDELLPKYNSYKASIIKFFSVDPYAVCTSSRALYGETSNCEGLPKPVCTFKDEDMSYTLVISNGPLCSSDTVNAYVDHMFSHSDQIKGMKRYFTNAKNNLDDLMNQQGDFPVPGCTQAKEIDPEITCDDSK